MDSIIFFHTEKGDNNGFIFTKYDFYRTYNHNCKL